MELTFRRFNPNRFQLTLGLLLFFSGVSPNAFGAYGNYRDDRVSDIEESAHLLSIGAGISSPSITSSLVENPAGLYFSQQGRFLGSVGWTNSNLNPIGLGGQFFLGNGFVGGALGVQTFNQRGNNAGTITEFDFGLSAYVPGMNLSFGVSGSYTLFGGGYVPGTYASGRNLGVNAGLLYNHRGSVRLGATAFGLDNGIDALAAGIATDPTMWSTFAVDASINPRSWNGITLKPALGIHVSEFQLTLGYGIALDSAANNYWSWINRGGSLGIGARLSYNLHLQAYYNQLALYYVGITYKF